MLSILDVPAEIVDAILTYRSMSIVQLRTLRRVCRTFRFVLSNSHSVKVHMTPERARDVVAKGLLAINPNITTIVDLKYSAFPLPLWSPGVPIRCTAINYNQGSMGSTYYNSTMDAHSAKRIKLFLDDHPRNTIMQKDGCQGYTIIVKHGDCPGDYENIGNACKHLRVAPKILVYRKVGQFAELPDIKGFEFKKKAVFPTIETLILEGFSFDEFLSIKNHNRFPLVPNCGTFQACNFGDVVERPDYGELFVKHIRPLLAPGDGNETSLIINRKV